MTVSMLIVDDEKEIRDMLSRHFRMMDFDVYTAEDGNIALEMLKENRVDILITDIMMPNMLGTELLNEVNREYPMIHKIVITGYVTLNNLLACMRYGANTCVFKPFANMDELEEAVTEATMMMDRWQIKLKELMGLKSGSK